MAILGHLDGLFGREVTGWAYDELNPSRPVQVKLTIGNDYSDTVFARMPRPDLMEKKIGSGSYGFRIVLPEKVHKNSRGETISVVAIATGEHLTNSPQAIDSYGRHLEKTINLQELFVVFQPILSNLDVQTQALRLLLDRVTENKQPVREGEELAARKVIIQGDHANKRPAELTSAPMTPPSAVQLSPKLLAAERVLIVLSIIPWSYRIQRPQHLAKRFFCDNAKSNSHVIYVNPNFVVDQTARLVFKNIAENVDVADVHAGFGRSDIYTASFDDVSQWHAKWLFLELAKVLSKKEVYVRVDFPGWMPLLEPLKRFRLFYDCMDFHSGFSNVSEVLPNLEKALVKSADLITVTTTSLASKIESTKVVDVPNGCELLRFLPTNDDLDTKPRKIKGGGVVGYVGAIAEWFDFDLLVGTAKRLKDWQFRIVGRADVEIHEKYRLENIEYLGEIPYETVPAFVHDLDVCIIPFKVNELTHHTDPVKAYEYLGAGKPIVASPMPELDKFGALVKQARGIKAFTDGIISCAQEDRPVLRKKRIDSVRNFDWAIRAQTIWSALDAHVCPRVSIVILHYGPGELTASCLYSVLENSRYSNLEVIVVDNGSEATLTDYTRQMPSVDQRVKLINSKVNLGFSGGNNLGIRGATGEYVILLNNDTYVSSNWVWGLIKHQLRDPQLGLVGPTTNMIGNEQKRNVSYKSVEEIDVIAEAIGSQFARAQFDIDRLAFFCVSIRRSVIAQIGYLDEEFGIGMFEDDDYCLRARKAGWRLAIADDVFIHHEHSATFNKLPNKHALFEINKRLFEKRWGKWTPHKYRDHPAFGG